MKTAIILVSALLSSGAYASPKVISAFVNMNAQQCEGIAAMADTCESALTNQRKLEARLAKLDPTSAEYKKWAAFRGPLQDSVDFACEELKADTAREMAMAVVVLATPVEFPSENLNKGVLGRIAFNRAEAKDGKISLPAAQVKMTVYGQLYCQAVVKAGGNSTAALETIAAEILGN